MGKAIRRRGVESRRELVTRQVSSGLSVQEFCRREGLNAWTFYGWRSRLLRARATVAEEPAAESAIAEEPASGFIELGALGRSSSRCEIRLDLGGGVVLHVVRG